MPWSTSSGRSIAFVLLSIVASIIVPLAQASTPNIILSIDGVGKTWWAKRGEFGSDAESITGELVHSPPTDNFLCDYFNDEIEAEEVSNMTVTVPAKGTKSYADVDGPFIMMVPRGLCTWERKAYAARELFGAAGIIIYDNLSARYRINETTKEVIFPKKEQDYECSNGLGSVRDINLDPPAYNPDVLDKVLDMSSPFSDCSLTGRNECESQLCLVTSHKPDSTEYPVCCAWDNLITMPEDRSMKEDEPGGAGDIVPIFITIRQGQEFLEMMAKQRFPLVATIKNRPRKTFNVSMIFLYILGVAITAFACWYSAHYYRYFGKKLDAMEADNDRRKSVHAAAMDLDKDDADEDSTSEDVFNDEDGNKYTDDEESGEKLPPPPKSKRFSTRSIGSKKRKPKKGLLRSLPPPDRRRGIFNWLFDDSVEDDMPRNESDEVVIFSWSPGERHQSQAQRKGLFWWWSGENNQEDNPTMDSIDNDDEALNDLDDQEGKISHDLNVEDDEVNNDSSSMVLYSLPPPEGRKSRRSQSNPPRHTSQRSLRRGGSQRSLRRGGSQRSLKPGGSSRSLNGSSKAPQVWAPDPEPIELNMNHVVMFVVMASLLLLLLFFFKFYFFITILYAIGCSGCVSHLIFGPILVRLIPKLGDDWVREMNKKVMCHLNGFDVTSQLIGLVWAAIWLWYGFTHYRPMLNAFFWLTLNIFGACFCILVLSMVKLYNIQIATALMVAVFIYDIFFVFITPLIFDGESIMITVARGGKTGSSFNDDFCYKYPDDKDCTGLNFLPMLLSLPRINDWTGSSSFLGLGDIVLPGFLIAFGARVDEAKRLLSKHTNKDVPDVPRAWYEGYFFPLMVAYAVGLLLANMAVILMKQGQPALLYLVPCVLGTMFVIGRKDLKELWDDSKDLRAADKFITKCEKIWSRERMKRELERRKREVKRRKSIPKRGLMDVLENGGSFRGPGTSPTRESKRSLSPKRVSERPPGRTPGRGSDRASGRNPGRNPGRPSEGPPGRNPGRGRSSGRGPAPNRGRSPGPARGRGPGRGGPGRGRGRGRGRGGPGGRTGRGRTSAQRNKAQREVEKTDSRTDTGPANHDVCFGDQRHPGTKEFRRIVQKSLSTFGDEDYSPRIYQSIKKRLDGRRFFARTASGSWGEATKRTIVDEIGTAYDEEKNKNMR